MAGLQVTKRLFVVATMLVLGVAFYSVPIPYIRMSGFDIVVSIFGAVDFVRYPQTAPGYSGSAFRHVQVGDTPESVRSLLGEPLHVWGPVMPPSPHACKEGWWYYREPRRDENPVFVRAIVVFGFDGKVQSTTLNVGVGD